MVEIRPGGDIDVDNAFHIREEVDRVLVERRIRRIVVDLADVSVIDSVGIGVLVTCYHAATVCGVRFSLAAPSTVVYRQLWVSGLIGLFGLSTAPRSSHRTARVNGHP